MEGDFYVDYGKLDDYQRTIIETLFHRSEVVGGKAGTGKSLIALHKLAKVPPDKRSSLVVYTKALKKYFEDGLKTLNIPNAIVQYKDEWTREHVDYIFVDECQDFTADEINEFINSGEKVFFFGDTSQTIMNFAGRVTQTVEDTAEMVGVRPDYLYNNYRLTKENAALAEYIGKRDDLVRYCIRNGVKPQLIEGATFNQQLDAIIDIIKTRNLTRACILVPYNTDDSALCSPNNDGKLAVKYVQEYCVAKGMPVEVKMKTKTEDVITLDFNSSAPKIISWHSVKGLQFNDVFIPFCETGYDDSMKRALYVAITRAYNRLYLGYTGRPNPSIFPPVNSEIFARKTTIEEI